jgi:hypothetical protein
VDGRTPAPTERWSQKLRRPPYRNAAVVISIAITLACVFAISYSLALGRPTPHHIPAALVGNAASRAGVIPGFEVATHNGLELTRYPTLAAASAALEQQKIFGILDFVDGRAQLYIASAAGTSVARLLSTTASQVSQTSAGPVVVTDLHPLPSGDPEGLVAFYVTLAATILGFVTMFQLRGNAAELPLRAWLVCIAIVAVVGGLALALVTDPLIGALRGAFGELWLALTVQVGTAAMFNAAMLTLVGRWAMIPTWTTFVAIGNASSGGAVAPPLLPLAYRILGWLLPNAATVEIIRNAVYFQHAQKLQPAIVEACWLLGSLTLMLVVERRTGRTPGRAAGEGGE